MSRRSALVIADTDSYAKWGAALASRLPADWDASLVIVETREAPSDGQLRAALAGTRFEDEHIRRIRIRELAGFVTERQPDAIVTAMRGPIVQVVVREATGTHDPVIVTGIPGIALPARKRALRWRSHADIFVLHSQQEIDAYAQLQDAAGTSQTFGLATLPFISGEIPTAAPGDADVDEARPVIFATQAIVPFELEDRLLVLRALEQLAASRSGEVVIKVRALAGEAQTHREEHDYAALLEQRRERAAVPANLVVRAGPMVEFLREAGGFVTVSSTAALEAIDHGVPAILIDSFGVNDGLINTAFIGSGLFGGLDELAEGRFRHPSREWLTSGYLHGREAETWIGELEAAVEARAAGSRPVKAARLHLGEELRQAWDRRQAFGELDDHPLGGVALVVGTVAKRVRGLYRSARRSVGRREGSAGS